MDQLTSQGHLQEIQFPGGSYFVAQAYADDSFVMPQNSQQELQLLMNSLSLFGLAAGLHVNFEKSKLIDLKNTDWHGILWPREIVDSHAVVKHLKYPIG